RERLHRGAAVYPVEVDGTTFDLMERFGGLEASKADDRRAGGAPLRRAWRRAPAAVLRGNGSHPFIFLSPSRQRKPKRGTMAVMIKPVSLRLEDADVRKVRPCVYLVRAASATLRSFVTGATSTNAAKAMFGNDVVTDLILRAPTAPAAISGTSGWAQSL